MCGLVDFLLILSSVDEHAVFADVSQLYSSSVGCSSAGFRLVSDKVLDALVCCVDCVLCWGGLASHDRFRLLPACLHPRVDKIPVSQQWWLRSVVFGPMDEVQLECH